MSLTTPRTPALYRGFGAVGNFRPLRSGPDQARHLPEAPVPRPRKSLQSHTRGVPRAASHDCIRCDLLYTYTRGQSTKSRLFTTKAEHKKQKRKRKKHIKAHAEAHTQTQQY